MSSIIICPQDAGNGEVEVAVSYEGEPFNAFSRADGTAGVLAEYADAARVAGNQCTAAYQALTVQP